MLLNNFFKWIQVLCYCKNKNKVGIFFKFPNNKTLLFLWKQATKAFLYAMIPDYLQLRKCYLDKTSNPDAFGQPTKLSDSEIIYLYVVAWLDYEGNYAKSMSKSYENGNIKAWLDKSQYSPTFTEITT